MFERISMLMIAVVYRLQNDLKDLVYAISFM